MFDSGSISGSISVPEPPSPLPSMGSVHAETVNLHRTAEELVDRFDKEVGRAEVELANLRDARAAAFARLEALAQAVNAVNVSSDRIPVD